MNGSMSLEHRESVSLSLRWFYNDFLLMVVSWESLGCPLGVSWVSLGCLLGVCLLGVSWESLSSLSAVSLTSLALSFLIHFIIHRAYFIKPAELKILRLVVIV